MNEFHDISACPPARLPKNPRDIQAMLKVLVEAERCAVRGYTQICNMTTGKDHRTYDPSLLFLMKKWNMNPGSLNFSEKGLLATLCEEEKRLPLFPSS